MTSKLASPALGLDIDVETLETDEQDVSDLHPGPLNMLMFKGSQPSLLQAAISPECAPSMVAPSELPITQVGPHPKSLWGAGRHGPNTKLPLEVEGDHDLGEHHGEITGSPGRLYNQPIAPKPAKVFYGKK